jgi:hypothetical protein
MSFSVGLYRDFIRKGELTFRTVSATQSSDYVSKPEGVISQDETEHISRQLPLVGQNSDLCPDLAPTAVRERNQ